jgi:hypothetical protein
MAAPTLSRGPPAAAPGVMGQSIRRAHFVARHRVGSGGTRANKGAVARLAPFRNCPCHQRERAARRASSRGWSLLGLSCAGTRYAGAPSPSAQLQSSLVPSPGGWDAPAGVLPMWDWTSADGGRARLDRVPLIVRALYQLPFADRDAHAWMWHHGGWDVVRSTHRKD